MENTTSVAIPALSRFRVMTASARTGSRFGVYRRVALVEVDTDVLAHECEGNGPANISREARGILRIVETWERCNVGTTDRCAYSQALYAANEACTDQNEKYYRAHPDQHETDSNLSLERYDRMTHLRTPQPARV